MVQEDDKYVISGAAPLVPLLDISLGRLIYDSLLANPNKHPAMVDVFTKEEISYSQLLKKTCALAEAMCKSGFGKDTIIAISSENSIYFYIPVISALYIGAIVSPINQNYTEYETIHSLNISKPQIVFCSKAVSQKFVLLKKTKVDYIKKIIIIDSDDAVFGTETLNDFIGKSLKGYDPLSRYPLADFDPSTQLAFIMCSSGTTGLPKGVMQTHRNLIARYMHTIDIRFKIKCNSFLGILPFFHGFGLVTNFFAIVLGEKIVVMKKFEEETFLNAIQDHQITSLWLAPPLIVFLAKSPLVQKYDLSCVKEIVSGAAPLSKETEEMISKRLNIDYVRQGYGLTECTLAVTLMPVGESKRGSSGKVAPYMWCKLRDPETGKSLPPGQIGELCFKGAMVVPGYYKNEEATRNMFTSDGWLLTGDLGYYDEDGYFFIVDRLKELIKYKGFQVAPAELEAILLNHPKIKDVGVCGLPDEAAGELPVAFVVKNPNVSLSEKEVMDFVAEKVSSQKRLRGGVNFVSAIPKNPSGKILRRELRNMLKKRKSKL